MARDRVTSLDVAARAGVSQSAVSRVFTPGASVSPEMAAKVRAAADELGYRPNILARSLITGRSRIIGLVVAYLDNGFYPEALQQFSNALQERGYHILVFMASDAQGTDRDQVIEELLDYQVDGIIAASVAMSDDLAARCEAAGIPIVLFNRGQDDSRLCQVTSDNHRGGRLVADFLVAGDHAHIAHIAGWQGSSTGRDRAEGFAAGLAAHGRPRAPVIDGLYRREAAAEATRVLMARRQRPDALFVGNDHMAFAVLDVLRDELGLDVPGDVSVVGYDDVPAATWGGYQLTTVRQPMAEMVAATIDALLRRIEDPARAPQRLTLPCEIVLRQTARLPAAARTPPDPQ